MNNPARVTIVTVSYNSMAVLPQMLSSLPDNVQTIIVDNASDEYDALKVCAEQFGAKLIRNEDNLGFGVACNVGAKAADTEYLFFLNPDAAVTPDCIANLVAALDQNPECSAANPKIDHSNGRPQFQRRSFLLPRGEWMSKTRPVDTMEIAILSGAALFVRRSAFEKIGGFDPNIFLYHEDDDLAVRLKSECGPLYYVHNASVMHMAGHSTNRNSKTARWKAWHMGRSRVYATKKHGMRFGTFRAVFQAFTQLLSPVNLFVARKRAKHIGFFRGVVGLPLK